MRLSLVNGHFIHIVVPGDSANFRSGGSAVVPWPSRRAYGRLREESGVKWDGRLVFGAANAELAPAGIRASAFDDKLSCQVGSRSSMTLAALVLIAPLATQIPVQLIRFTAGAIASVIRRCVSKLV